MAKAFAKSLRTSIILMLLPGIELISLRLYLHNVIQAKIDFPFVSDYTFILPAPIAFFIMVYTLERAYPCEFKLQRKILLCNLALMITLTLLGLCSKLGDWEGWLPWGCALLLSVIISALCSFTRPSFYFSNPNRFVLAPAALIASCTAIETNCLVSEWKSLISFLGSSAGWFSHFAFGDTIKAFTVSPGALKIFHPQFQLTLQKGCTGLIGLLYFSMVFLIFATLNYQRGRLGRWVVGFFLGLSLIHVINLLSIFLLFTGGIRLRQLLGQEASDGMIKFLFQIHSEWVLFSLGMMAFFPLLGRSLGLSTQTSDGVFLTEERAQL